MIYDSSFNQLQFFVLRMSLQSILSGKSERCSGSCMYKEILKGSIVKMHVEGLQNIQEESFSMQLIAEISPAINYILAKISTSAIN